MARHKELAALTGLRVYFADPHAPWQRGSNENANGLVRQYLALGHRLVGVLAGRARRDRRPAQQSAAQDARLRDPRRGVRRAGGQGRQRCHVTKCGGCSLRNLNPPAILPMSEPTLSTDTRAMAPLRESQAYCTLSAGRKPPSAIFMTRDCASVVEARGSLGFFSLAVAAFGSSGSGSAATRSACLRAFSASWACNASVTASASRTCRSPSSPARCPA